MLLNSHFKLKTIFKSLAFVLPNMMFNPFGPNKVYVPIDIKPHSTYINYKLELDQVNILNSYIKSYNDSLSIVPIQLYDDYVANYYLSINIYNSSSPVFMTGDNIIRCEINTYIMDSNGKKGTLILDYMTNGLSMDPVDGLKLVDTYQHILFNKNENDLFNISCISSNSDIQLDFSFDTTNVYPNHLSFDLLEYTDNIYYKNGIIDKVFYDNSLLNPVLMGVDVKNAIFKYNNMTFENIHSVFYFKDNLYFIGSMWDNLNL